MRLTTPQFSGRELSTAITILSPGYRYLGSCSRAAGWSAALVQGAISVGFDMSATCPVRSRSRTCRRHGQEFRAGIQRAVDKGWMVRHESGTYVKFTPAGAELFT